MKKKLLAVCAVLTLSLPFSTYSEEKECDFKADSLAGKVRNQACTISLRKRTKVALFQRSEDFYIYQLSVQKNKAVFDFYKEDRYSYTQAAVSLAKWYRTKIYRGHRRSSSSPNDHRGAHARAAFRMLEEIKKERERESGFSTGHCAVNFVYDLFFVKEKKEGQLRSATMVLKKDHNLINLIRTYLRNGGMQEKDFALLISSLDKLKAFSIMAELSSGGHVEVVPAKYNLLVEVEKTIKNVAPELLACREDGK